MFAAEQVLHAVLAGGDEDEARLGRLFIAKALMALAKQIELKD